MAKQLLMRLSKASTHSLFCQMPPTHRRETDLLSSMRFHKDALLKARESFKTCICVWRGSKSRCFARFRGKKALLQLDADGRMA